MKKKDDLFYDFHHDLGNVEMRYWGMDAQIEREIGHVPDVLRTDPGGAAKFATAAALRNNGRVYFAEGQCGSGVAFQMPGQHRNSWRASIRRQLRVGPCAKMQRVLTDEHAEVFVCVRGLSKKGKLSAGGRRLGKVRCYPVKLGKR